LISDSDRKELIFEAEVYYDGMTDISKEFNELIRYLEEEVLKDELANSMNELRIAENKNDVDTVNRLLKKCQEISKKINELK